MMTYNESRDEQAMVALRPILYLETEGSPNEIEEFQNTTLRPILKMQHNILMDFVQVQPNFDAILAYKQKRTVFQERLRIFLQQSSIKGVLIGMIVGQFSREEFAVYQRNTKEYNMRILQMCGQRFVDSI